MNATSIRGLVALATGLEAITGVARMLAPGVLVALLLGGAPADAGIAVGRVAGIALLALGLACWPGCDLRAASRGLLVCNLPAAVYSGYIAVSGVVSGILWWPAFGAHTLLAMLLAFATRVEFRHRNAP